MLKYYLQPWLKLTLEAGGLAIIGPGALSIGAYEFVRNSVGGAGALASTWLERIAGGQGAALTLAYRGALMISLVLILCLWVDWLVVGLILMLGLTVLQNGRRPIFVSAFPHNVFRLQAGRVINFKFDHLRFRKRSSHLAPPETFGILSHFPNEFEVMKSFGIVFIRGGPQTDFVFSTFSHSQRRKLNRRVAFFNSLHQGRAGLVFRGCQIFLNLREILLEASALPAGLPAIEKSKFFRGRVALFSICPGVVALGPIQQVESVFPIVWIVSFLRLDAARCCLGRRGGEKGQFQGPPGSRQILFQLIAREKERRSHRVELGTGLIVWKKRRVRTNAQQILQRVGILSTI